LLLIALFFSFLLPKEALAVTAYRQEVTTVVRKNTKEKKRGKIFVKIAKKAGKSRKKKGKGLLILCLISFGLLVGMGLLLAFPALALVYPASWLLIGLCGYSLRYSQPKLSKVMMIISIVFNLGFFVVFGAFWLFLARHFD